LSLRIVEVLEKLATPEARTVLKELSERQPADRAAVEARRALKRVAKQP
jgi:hypothetical protein